MIRTIIGSLMFSFQIPIHIITSTDASAYSVRVIGLFLPPKTI